MRGPQDPIAELVLVVEDDEKARTALAELLMLEGYRAAPAVTGEEAIRMAQDLQPAVVLLDLVLPGLDGTEVARRLRRDPATAQIPIIATTCSWLGEQPDLLAAAGFENALRKPFTADELLTELKRALTRPSRDAPR